MEKINVTRRGLEKYIKENYKTYARFTRETGADKAQLSRYLNRRMMPYGPTIKAIERHTPFTFEEELARLERELNE